ncbi:MAG: dephospho-CoA kinase [Desulfocapsa sp.]|nr:dephospho-CoA kinase [Desulfocapsa sp.]
MKIAVTGGMGSGKSVVGKALADMIGAVSVSADTLCRELLIVGNPGWLRMQKSFGSAFFLEDRQVNRPVLRKAVFSDPVVREKLDALLHPLVRQELFALFRVAEQKGVDLVAEVPLLFEKGWQVDFDYTIVVFSAADICIERVMARDLVSRDDAQESISSQVPLADKVNLGDAVIDNSGPLSVTLEQVKQLVGKLAGESNFKGKTKEE